MNRTRGRGAVLAVIVARGGSKGLPRKNVLPLGGRPLIAWTVEAARAASCIGRVIVSTDNAEIAQAARMAGADSPFMRPPDLASDSATAVEVMAHALAQVPGHDAAVLLQPTSPFRTANDIDAGYSLWRQSGAPSCVSVCAASESPWLMYRVDENGQLERLLPEPFAGLRRQDLPRAFILNGALYFVDTARFLADRQFVYEKTVGFEMPLDRSIDIDTPDDFENAERQLAYWGGAVPQRG